MGYYEYDLLEGKYLFIIKYAAQDTEHRLAETTKIIEGLATQAIAFAVYP